VNRKKLWFFVLTTVILTSFISGCIGGGQFGAPSADSSVTIKGVVVAPDNNCFTDTCANPSIIEGDPLPNADIILKGDTHTLTGKTDCAGNYQISGLADDGYILYANRGEVWVKKAISPVTGDGGEANYLTTAQVILWEVIESSSPGSIPIKDIPDAIPFENIPEEFYNAVKAALADCRDAQQDKTVIGLAKTYALANFGAPCAPCVEGTPDSTPCVCPTPTPDCPIGVAEAVISYKKIEGLTYRFDASDSKPQTGSYPILTYNWVISEGGTKNRGKNGSGIVCQSDQKIFDCTLPKSGSYLINLTVATECESNSSQVALSTLGPRLLIKKVVVPEDPSSSWSFSLEGPNEFKTSFTLNSSNNWEKEFLPTDVPSLEPGQYTIIENEKSGYDCISIDIDGVSSPTIDLPNWIATFTLQSTANVTATFTNKKQEEEPAKLTVTKAFESGTTPDPNTKWSFTLTGPNNHSFDLPNNGNWSKVLENLTPGNYTLTETQQSGFECISIVVNGTGVSNINVDLANNKATFTLASEANVTVTFTNKKQEEKPAKLTVVKALDTGTTVPANPWKFELTGPNNHSFDLPENGNWSKVLENLTPGNYTLTETQQSGFVCTSIVVNGTGVSNINVDLANNKATFTLASEANVTATFTNKKFVPDNIQDILIVGPIAPQYGTPGSLRILSISDGPNAISFISIDYKFINDINYSGPYEAWCIDKNGFLTPGDYDVLFYPANNSNPAIGSLMDDVWGVINLGKSLGESVTSIQNEIWYYTDPGPNNPHNPIYDSITPTIQNGMVCY
jgi:hypothetical protein